MNLLNVSDVAKALFVSRPTIYDWIKKGKIKSITLPNGIKKIPESEVKKILGGL